jgi:hypothetical protein
LSTASTLPVLLELIQTLHHLHCFGPPDLSLSVG